MRAWYYIFVKEFFSGFREINGQCRGVKIVCNSYEVLGYKNGLKYRMHLTFLLGSNNNHSITY